MWGVVKTRGSPTLLKQVQQPNILSLMTRRRPASSTWFPDNKSRNPAGALFHEESTGHYGRSKPGRSQVIHQNRLDFRVLADVLESRMQEVNGIHIIQTRTFWIECITSRINWSPRIISETSGNHHPPAHQHPDPHWTTIEDSKSTVYLTLATLVENLFAKIHIMLTRGQIFGIQDQSRMSTARNRPTESGCRHKVLRRSTSSWVYVTSPNHTSETLHRWKKRMYMEK